MVDDFEKYERDRYHIKCQKCGHLQFDLVNGDMCIKCKGICVKVED